MKNGKYGKSATFVYCAAVIVLSLGLFYSLEHLSGSQIKFLLDFYKDVVEIFFSNYHYFDEEFGYYVGSNYIIGENCLGLNITVLIFGVCGLAGAGKLRGRKRLLWLLFSGLMAVIVGVFANILRLLSSIYFTVFAHFELIHALLGIVIYLSAIIFCYMFSIKILNRPAADTTQPQEYCPENNAGGENDEEHI